MGRPSSWREKPTSWVGELADHIEDEIHRLAQTANQDLPEDAGLLKSNKMIKLAEIRAQVICDSMFPEPKSKEHYVEECKKIGFEPPELKLP